MEKDTVKDLKILILLNAWDGIISYIGVFTKNIEEWNPFMRNIVSDIRLLAAVKIIVPTLIIITIIFLINSGGYSPSKAVKKLIKTAEETKQRDKGEDVQRRTPTGRLCAGHDRAAEYAVCRVFQKIPAGSEVEKRWPLELEAKEEKKEKKHATSQALAASYIGNKNSKKFHLSDCSGQKRLLWGTGSRDEAIKAWYEPCKVCKP